MLAARALETCCAAERCSAKKTGPLRPSSRRPAAGGRPRSAGIGAHGLVDSLSELPNGLHKDGGEAELGSHLAAGGHRLVLFRVVRYLPVARYGRGHGTDLRAGVGQAPREETAGHAAVLDRRLETMAI